MSEYNKFNSSEDKDPRFIFKRFKKRVDEDREKNENKVNNSNLNFLVNNLIELYLDSLKQEDKPSKSYDNPNQLCFDFYYDKTDKTKK